MPIIDLQLRLRECGRIRMGMKGDRGQPVKLKNFRLTSADRDALEAAAKLYGGTVRPWDEQPGQFELFTESPEIPILICDMPVDQWYELWSGGGCQRRCDGQTEQISDRPCLCDPENRTCEMVTRLKVMLPQLPAVGVWRLETGGYFGATEIPGIVELFRGQAREAMAGRAKFPECSLAIESRTIKKPGEPTKNFVVPTIRIKQTLLEALQGTRLIAAAEQETRAIAAADDDDDDDDPDPTTQRPNDPTPPRPQAPTSHATPPRPQVANRTASAPTNGGKWAGPGKCPSCNAPAGMSHGTKCTSQAAATPHHLVTSDSYPAQKTEAQAAESEERRQPDPEEDESPFGPDQPLPKSRSEELREFLGTPNVGVGLTNRPGIVERVNELAGSNYEPGDFQKITGRDFQLARLAQIDANEQDDAGAAQTGQLFEGEAA